MNYYVYSQQPILMAINTGTFGQHLEQLADPKIIQQAMHALQTMYGEHIPQPEDYLITRWGDDPYTQGAYSYIPVGVSGKAYDAMATPIDDRLFFAGEATSRDYASTVHGAFLSGKREAKRIRNVLC